MLQAQRTGLATLALPGNVTSTADWAGNIGTARQCCQHTSRKNPAHTFLLFLVSISVLSYHLRLRLSKCVFSSRFLNLHALLITAMRTTCPAELFVLDLFVLISGEQQKYKLWRPSLWRPSLWRPSLCSSTVLHRRPMSLTAFMYFILYIIYIYTVHFNN